MVARVTNRANLEHKKPRIPAGLSCKGKKRGQKARTRPRPILPLPESQNAKYKKNPPADPTQQPRQNEQPVPQDMKEIGDGHEW